MHVLNVLAEHQARNSRMQATLQANLGNKKLQQILFPKMREKTKVKFIRFSYLLDNVFLTVRFRKAYLSYLGLQFD